MSDEGVLDVGLGKLQWFCVEVVVSAQPTVVVYAATVPETRTI